MKTYKVSRNFIIIATIKKIPLLLMFILIMSGAVVLFIGAINVVTQRNSFIEFSYFLISLIILTIIGIGNIIYNINLYKSYSFYIGEDKIGLVGGILKKVEMTTDYGKIAQIAIIQGVFERWLGFANIYIQTPGLYNIIFFGLNEANANEIRDLILSKRNIDIVNLSRFKFN
ncbi:MAG: PH domain-containing protein [Candidatus Omnitrophota bacterium]